MLMEYFFDAFASNTTASTGNQLISLNTRRRTGRVSYKVFADGRYNYSFLFSNSADSTFFTGEQCRANFVGDTWKIYHLRATVSNSPTSADESAFAELTFNGRKSKLIAPGEFFVTDMMTFDVKEGQYICLEITFSGRAPYHQERQVSTFVKHGNKWEEDREIPLPSMIGCDRRVKKRILFWGDSITQGIGVPCDSYMHYAARFAELAGRKYAYWNLGLGFGRGSDAASCGGWMYKAKHADIAFICFGVNDIARGDAYGLKNNLTLIVEELKKAGQKVIVQTVPPAAFEGEKLKIWLDTNEYIRNELAAKADGIFDTVPILGEKDAPHKPACGNVHPNEEMCEKWARALYEANFLEEEEEEKC